MSLHTFSRQCCLLAALLLLLVSSGRPAAASPSGVTYLGQLLVGGAPANGSYDFQFKLFDAATGGTQVGSTVSLTSVPVAGGVYSAFLYFGSGLITGQNLWLQISYRVHPSSGSPAYTTLSPRQVAPNSAFADYAQLSGSTAALQGKGISTAAPATGQVLKWNGSLWTPATIAGGTAYTAGTGLSLSSNQFSVTSGGITSSLLANGSVTGSKLALPLTASVSSSSDLFTLSNTGSGRAIVGNSTNNTAVKGVGHNGVYGQGTNYGVQASGTNYGVYSISPAIGVYGSGTGSSGIGVSASGTLFGLQATSAGTGITSTGTGTNSDGIVGNAGSNGYGVIGQGGYLGVYGHGSNYGVYGSGSDYGLYGGAGSSGYGVYGSSGYIGVAGSGTTYGVYGTGSTYGMYASGGTCGVYGSDYTNGTYGVLGSVNSYGYDTGVVGESEGTTTYKVGVEGRSLANSGLGIWGIGDETNSATNNFAGYFSGNVYVAGTLSKAGGSFKIDDPIDPAHKTLSHSFVESPDMMNLYNGNITTDASGDATITMPKWFSALNQDFRYQLTVIGQFAQAIVATEMQKNQFTIKTDKPGVKVSWMVTGIRHDAWANANRIPVEEDKPTEQQGKFLNPASFGLSASMGIHPAPSASQAPRSAPKPPALPARQMPQP